ncbi:hypothetical protein HNR05_000719 [Leifsonia psychrotolerans]|uniref:Uncharacterized protein n=1 Tax=Glaciibacter psychrotolerans TaxID=670054 RepID=A0A7Z0ECE3_9MICO|nr:hypothetical protein [Leifsonia psychrotolerans]
MSISEAPQKFQAYSNFLQLQKIVALQNRFCIRSSRFRRLSSPRKQFPDTIHTARNGLDIVCVRGLQEAPRSCDAQGIPRVARHAPSSGQIARVHRAAGGLRKVWTGSAPPLPGARRLLPSESFVGWTGLEPVTDGLRQDKSRLPTAALKPRQISVDLDLTRSSLKMVF